MLSHVFEMMVAALTGSYIPDEDFRVDMAMLKDLLLDNAIPSQEQTEEHLNQVFREIQEGICWVHTTDGKAASTIYVYIFDKVFPNLIINYFKENPFRNEFMRYEILYLEDCFRN